MYVVGSNKGFFVGLDSTSLLSTLDLAKAERWETEIEAQRIAVQLRILGYSAGLIEIRTERKKDADKL